MTGAPAQRPTRRGGAALCLAALLLSACGGQDAADQGDRRPSAGVQDDQTRAQGDTGEESALAEVFGSGVRPREEGAFGLDRWRALSAEASADEEPSTGASSGGSATAFRVVYPAGSVSPSASREYGAPGGGMQVYLPRVDGPLDEAYLRYRVRFPADFAFAKGGKLPGLWGGSQVSGGEEPDGTNGFSTRLMWRSEGAGEVYLYAPGHTGTSLGRGDWRWPTGTWTCVEQHVVLNDPEENNGSVAVWVDGKQVYEKADLRYRTVDDLKIEGIFFSTFFGGADRDWASPRDQYADFADFELGPEPVGCA